MRTHLRSNIVGYLALFVAVAGPAAAVGAAIDGPAPGKDSVGSLDLINGQVMQGDLANNAVMGAKVLDGSLGAADIADGSLGAADIADGTLRGADIADGSVSQADVAANSLGQSALAQDSVGASELRGVFGVVAATGTHVQGWGQGTNTVTCPGTSMLIAGGYEWATDMNDPRVVRSSPSETDPNKTWRVDGIVSPDTAGNTLYAWATCLMD
jgi:hypothetical protein